MNKLADIEDPSSTLTDDQVDPPIFFRIDLNQPWHFSDHMVRFMIKAIRSAAS